MTGLFRVAVVALTVVVAGAAGSALAADPPTPSADDMKLESLMSDADLFYKKSYSEGGQRWEYKTQWTAEGETSTMVVYLKSLGRRGDGSTIWAVYSWTPVMFVEDGETLPPAVIKLIAGANDNVTTGNFSTSKYGVFANTGMIFEELTAKQLRWMLWDMHYNRVEMKKLLAEQD